jgi:hypothetical protein
LLHSAKTIYGVAAKGIFFLWQVTEFATSCHQSNIFLWQVAVFATVATEGIIFSGMQPPFKATILLLVSGFKVLVVWWLAP